MSVPSVADLIRLCERVLATNISEDELREAWPEAPDDASFLELRETLFSALEHVPGRVVDGTWQLNWEAWRSTPEYENIEAHLRQLRRIAPDH